VFNNKKEGVSEATRQTVQKAIDEFNYNPNAIAKSMVTKKTSTIALIVPDICNSFFAELARGVENYCRDNGFCLLLANTNGITQSELDCVESLKDRMVDGMIFTTQNTTEYSPVFREFTAKDYPFVTVERYIDTDEARLQIRVDNRTGIEMAVNHLLDCGHTKIAFLTGPLTTTNAIQRYQGYEDALIKLGIRLDYGLVREGEYKYHAGYELTTDLLNKKKGCFTALAASNDLMAVGAMNAVREFGLSIPEDISITGFDNASISSYTYPKLTTVDISTYEMGMNAAELLINVIENHDNKPKLIESKPKLIKRGSVKLI